MSPFALHLVAFAALLARFATRFVEVTVRVVLVWGELIGQLERAGSPVAASALEGKYRLVTQNEEHFQNTGVLLANPWKLP